MGRKAKYTPEQKVQACEDYLSGKKSAIQIARDLNMGKHGKVRVREWVKKYKAYGASAFEETHTNKSYSKQFKEKVVKEYLSGKGSQEDLALRYGIPSRVTVLKWVLSYNNHIELKDYDPKSEVYMAERRKTSFDERLEIVKYCLEHNRGIKNTASLYKCSYAQVRSWLIKYEVDGEEGLTDRRGIRKKEEELSDLEKAKRQIARLQREKEEFRKKYELLKKAETLERW
ncbi:MAG: transposase [Erysipelotrichaceae bacterium]|nr:transposase [Erysipelotrichaceae bacterium]